MAEHESVQPEHARRNLVLYSAFLAAALAGASSVPSWLTIQPHRVIDLFMQAVPPISAAALLAGLCIGFVSLSPHSRPSFVTALTFPGMHISITVALAQLLSSRQSALIEPLPQQRPIQAWLSPSTWLLALGAELVVFVLAALVGRLSNRQSPLKEC